MDENQTDSKKTEFDSASVAGKLDKVIDTLPPDKVTVAEIRDLVGDDAVLLLTLLLCIIFMVPVSIPGVSTVFGAAILLSGVSRLFGKKLWLPSRIARRALQADKVKAGLAKGSKWMHRIEGISRPHRMEWVFLAGSGNTISNLALILGAVLLMAPFGFVPFSNTLPALALMLLAMGMLQRDGLCVLLGHVTNLVTMAYFAVLLLGGTAAIHELLKRLGS